jgi:hypothetical protein
MSSNPSQIFDAVTRMAHAALPALLIAACAVVGWAEEQPAADSTKDHRRD